MTKEWQSLTRWTQGRPAVVERVRLPDDGVAIEGEFELPPLAQLSPEDQVFVAAFVRCHGSIKRMEQFFGVSYPTVKSRLKRIGEQLPFVEIDMQAPTDEVLTKLEAGEISVDKAVEMLER